MFSRIGRSVCRSSRTALNKGAFPGSYGTRSAELSPGNAFASRENWGLGFLRSYLTSIGAGKHVLKEFNSDFGSRALRRQFCSESPKKNAYENYRPTKKTEIPKEKNQNSGSEGSGADMASYYIDKIPKLHVYVIGPFLLLISVLIWIIDKKREISFQQFKDFLLEPGLVEHIVVSNESVAKVYVKGSHVNYKSDFMKRYRCYFNIEKFESLEEKLEEAQKALGIDPINYVPVTYTGGDLATKCQILGLAGWLLITLSYIKKGAFRTGGLGVKG